MSANTKLSNEQILAGWLSQPHFGGHFYVKRVVTFGEMPENTIMVLCQCPSMSVTKPNVYSGIAFFWAQDADILARPETFFLNDLPAHKFTHLGDPNCFTLMEERLKLLHDFFKKNRTIGM